MMVSLINRALLKVFPLNFILFSSYREALLSTATVLACKTEKGSDWRVGMVVAGKSFILFLVYILLLLIN